METKTFIVSICVPDRIVVVIDTATDAVVAMLEMQDQFPAVFLENVDAAIEAVLDEVEDSGELPEGTILRARWTPSSIFANEDARNAYVSSWFDDATFH